LEFLRILSNLVGGGWPVIQVVLSGQPELDEILQQAAQRALRQRIAVRARIRPLTRREVAAYLRFKLSCAGASPTGVLSRAAIRRIAVASAGFPRRVNIIADNALMAGFGADRNPIDRRIVGRALAALDDRPRRRVWAVAARFALPAVLALAVVGWSAIPSPFGAGADHADRALAAPSTLPALVLGVPPPAEPAAPVGASPDVTPIDVAPIDGVLAEAVSVAVVQPDVAAPRRIAYRVQPGDSLTMILRQHALPTDAVMLEQLRRINPELSDVDRLYAGQELLLPTPAP
jgi:general secretion pathway protein A